MSLVLICPACETRYVAKAAGFEPPGRTVRCSKCGHTWFQEVDPPDEDWEDLYQDFEAADEDSPAAEAKDGEDRLGGTEDRWNDDRFADGEPEDSGWDQEPVSTRYDDRWDEEIAREEFEPVRDRSRDREPEFGAAMDAEPETRKKRKKKKRKEEAERPERERSGFFGAVVWMLGIAAFVGTLSAAAWYFRPVVESVLPQAKAIYALVSAPEPVSNFLLQNTGYIEATEYNRHVLIVSGEVVNTSAVSRPVPAIRVTVRNSAGEDLDQWTFVPRGEDIQPGEERYFESRRLNPPEGAQRLHVIVIEEG